MTIDRLVLTEEDTIKKLRRAWEIGRSIVARAVNPILERKLGFQEEDRLTIGEIPGGWTLDRASQEIAQHLRALGEQPRQHLWAVGFYGVDSDMELTRVVENLVSVESLAQERLSHFVKRITEKHALGTRHWIDSQRKGNRT